MAAPTMPHARPQPAAATPGAVPWRAVALPAEHGGWGLLAEPAILGLVLAPSSAGLCLATSALAAFLARHPLRLVLMDRRRRVRYPRTALAERAFGAYALGALLLLAASLMLAGQAFWPALLAALVLAPVLSAKARQEERWLRQQFPEYVVYEQRVKRFIPWIW